jgi:hypothetical protein
VVYPVVSQKTLQDIVTEFKAVGFDFDREVQERMRSRFRNALRRDGRGMGRPHVLLFSS